MTHPETSAGPIALQDVIDNGRIRGVQLRVFVLCALVALLDGVDNQSIGIVAPALSKELGLNPGQMGFIFSAAQAGATVGALAFGPLADRFGRKPMVMLATAIIAAFTYLTAIAPSFGTLLIIRVVAGVGLAGAIPPLLALTSEYAPKRLRGTMVTVIFAGYPLGGAVGGFANGWLISQFDWRMVFYVGTTMPIIVFCLIWALVPESLQYLFSRGRTGRRVEGVLKALAPSIEPSRITAPERDPSAKGGVPVKLLFAGGLATTTILLWGLYFFAFATLKIMVVWFPTIMKDAGYTLSQASYALGFFNLGTMAGMTVSGMLVDRFGPFRVLAPALVMGGVSMFVLTAATGSLSAIIAIATLIGFFVGTGGSGAHAIAVAIYPPEVRSTGVGLGLASSRFGQVVSPTIVGQMLNAGMSSGAVYTTIAMSPLLAALMVVLLKFGVRAPASGAATAAPAE